MPPRNDKNMNGMARSPYSRMGAAAGVLARDMFTTKTPRTSRHDQSRRFLSGQNYYRVIGDPQEIAI